MGCEIDGIGFVHPFHGMAKQNRYAEKASQQLEVAGRKLRTDNPDLVREIVRVAEKRAQREQRRLTELSDERGAVFAAIRLKGIS